ncbi:B2 bradykinin receptor-like [Archocentrus centrarchus]|uniref:B2 bradykinin receptor-like n=1 Tax=Archocentrus centrarchus TaxID=63155 RepID=UPI0011E9DB6A|nr:B2 bradykinin receptor-like [Archocentrus centrarchus]
MSGNQNNTNGSQCSPEPGSLIFTLGSHYILVISVFGIAFNVFVLMVFCLHKKACTVAEIYLSNLAGADLILVCCLPFWAEYVRKGNNWSFTESLCKVVTAAIKMNASCSIYFLVLVSIDRYVALVYPLSNEKIRRPFYAKLGCLFVWGLGLVFALPALIDRKLVTLPSNVTICTFDYTENQYLVSEGMNIMFSFIIPVSIISFCTLKIIRALRNRLMESLNTQRTEQKTNTLILAVLLAFLICWGPFHLSRILDVFEKVDILSCHIIMTIYKYISLYLAFFNSVLNPILYVIIGKTFQKRATELFKQWEYKRTSRASLMSIRTRVTSFKLSENGSR